MPHGIPPKVGVVDMTRRTEATMGGERKNQVFEYIPRAQLDELRRTYAAATGLPTNVFNCPLNDDGSVDVTRLKRILPEQPKPEFCTLAGRLTADTERPRHSFPPQTCAECDSYWATLALRYRDRPDAAKAEVKRLWRKRPAEERSLPSPLRHIHRPFDPPYVAYTCHVGLLDLVAPIYISREPMALIYGGQWRREGHPDDAVLAWLEGMARDIGRPAPHVISAYLRVPEITDYQLEAAARHLGGIAHVLSEIGHRTQHLKRIGASAAVIAASADADTTYDRILRAARDVTGSDRVTLWELSADSAKLVRLATHARDETRARLPEEQEVGEGAAGWVARYKQPLEVDNVHNPWWHHNTRLAKLPKWKALRVPPYREDMKSEYAVPCVAERELVGVLSVKRKEAGRFSPRIKESLQLLSSHVAVAIRNVRSRQSLEEALDTQGRFLRLASHQLITPMGSIQMAGEALREWADTSEESLGELREMGEDIQALASVAVARTRDLLALAGRPRGGFQLSTHETTVTELVEHAVNLVRPLARERNVRVRLIKLGDLPLVCVDPEKMADLAIRNALENAIRYSPAGGTVDVTGSQTKHGDVRLAVRTTDRGCRARSWRTRSTSSSRATRRAASVLACRQ